MREQFAGAGWVAAWLAVLTLPFVLQPRAKQSAGNTAEALVIISPHNEAVRREFAAGFQQWHLEKFGAPAAVEWRNIGGTSEIARYLDSAFQSAARAGRDGIGIDLFFGGGQYDHARQTALGHTQPSVILKRRPEWFLDDVIPRQFTGETFYDTNGYWLGCCLSSFGICYNTDILAAKGIPSPATWRDLADFRFFGQLALADPSKSGSINKAFEVLVQGEILRCVQKKPDDRAAALAEGWDAAWRLLRAIGANARYFTDAASKVPVDVAHGDAVAGMCIDFYGRFESEFVLRDEQSLRLVYLTPRDNISVSVDPISILAGAPHKETAEHFVEFVLSPEGQKLWNYRVGTPGGPRQYALRRLPVRCDMYTPEHRQYMADPDAMPYTQTASAAYEADLTLPLFNYIRILMRAMCIDPHEELKAAWQAIHAAGGPEAVPEAADVFYRLPHDAGYAVLQDLAKRRRTRREEMQLAHNWLLFFRAQYQQAEKLARRASQGCAKP